MPVDKPAVAQRQVKFIQNLINDPTYQTETLLDTLREAGMRLAGKRGQEYRDILARVNGLSADIDDRHSKNIELRGELAEERRKHYLQQERAKNLSAQLINKDEAQQLELSQLQETITKLETDKESLGAQIETLINDLRNEKEAASETRKTLEDLQDNPPVDPQWQMDKDNLTTENAKLAAERRAIEQDLAKARFDLARANSNVANHLQTIGEMETETQGRGQRIKGLIDERDAFEKERDAVREKMEESTKTNKAMQGQLLTLQTANAALREQTKTIPDLRKRDIDANEKAQKLQERLDQANISLEGKLEALRNEGRQEKVKLEEQLREEQRHRNNDRDAAKEDLRSANEKAEKDRKELEARLQAETKFKEDAVTKLFNTEQAVSTMRFDVNTKQKAIDKMKDERNEAQQKLLDHQRLAQQGSSEVEKALKDAGNIREEAQTEIRDANITINNWKSFALEGVLADTEWMTRKVDVKTPLDMAQEGHGVKIGHVREMATDWRERMDISLNSKLTTDVPLRILAVRIWYTATTKPKNLAYEDLASLIFALENVDPADCAIVLGFLEATLNVLARGTGAATDEEALFMVRGMEYFHFISYHQNIELRSRLRLAKLNGEVLARVMAHPSPSVLVRGLGKWLEKIFANGHDDLTTIEREILRQVASQVSPESQLTSAPFEIRVDSDQIIELASTVILPDRANVLILSQHPDSPSVLLRSGNSVTIRFADNELNLHVYVRGYPAEGEEVMLKVECTGDFIEKLSRLFPEHQLVADQDE
jgi:chromosome segregation ATPase